MEQATAKAVPVENPIRLKVAGMDCGSCALTIESSLQQLAGVETASVSFTTETLEVTGNVTVNAIASRLKELGYRIAETDATVPPIVPQHRGLKGFLRFLWEQPALRRGLIVAAAVLASIVVIPALAIGPVFGVPSLTLVFGTAVLIAGAPIVLKGLRSLIFARRVTIDLLMAIAACGAIGIGETGEAITVILLFMLGEALEAYSAERARDSLRSLMSLQPQEATVLETHVGHHGDQDHGADDHQDRAQHAHHTIRPVEQIAVGDRVLVRPGERIPVDGQVIKGMSSVNQAPVTGEDMPVLKTMGDDVMAGTVNGEAAIEVRVNRVAAEGTIARIAKLVEQAQAQRSPAERFIDRFARYYTPAVVAIAILIVIIPVLAFSAPFLDTADGTRGWLYRGLTLLIIACPCALVISIPVTVVSGLTRLAQLGVLVKSGALLDRMADIRTIAFDKTGTLTHGKPIVTSMRTADCAHDASQYDECDPCDAAVGAAASVERASEHPVAHAIVTAASGHVAMAQDVQAHPGQGVSGILEDGARVTVGSRGLFDQTEEGWDSVAAHADAAENHGETIMYVSHNDKVIGYIGVQDEIRDGSNAVLTELANMQPPVRTVMLTGDNPQSAARVAERLDNIDEVRAGLLPAEKLAGIEALHTDGAAVAMVGDGINDAPALARADIGIAMGGSGTAQAMETADVVLMQDDLSQVPLALRMARRARYVIKQNIVLSLGLKLIFLALAIPGIATLWMAVLADVGATLLVTLNGMRLLRQR